MGVIAQSTLTTTLHHPATRTSPLCAPPDCQPKALTQTIVLQDFIICSTAIDLRGNLLVSTLD